MIRFFPIYAVFLAVGSTAFVHAAGNTPQPHPAIVRIIAPENSACSFGSGTLVAVNRQYGLVVTNWHVVRDATGPIFVAFPDGFYTPARVMKTDRDWDLAALVVLKPNAAPLPVATEPARLGERLTIAGYGSGWYRMASGECTQYLSPGSNLPFELVELSTGARNGDSGGPIINDRGEIAGVLFGSAFGKTTGSYCGRLRLFLSTLERDFNALPPPVAPPGGNPSPGNLPDGLAASQLGVQATPVSPDTTSPGMTQPSGVAAITVAPYPAVASVGPSPSGSTTPTHTIAWKTSTIASQTPPVASHAPPLASQTPPVASQTSGGDGKNAAGVANTSAVAGNASAVSHQLAASPTAFQAGDRNATRVQQGMATSPGTNQTVVRSPQGVVVSAGGANSSSARVVASASSANPSPAASTAEEPMLEQLKYFLGTLALVGIVLQTLRRIAG